MELRGPPGGRAEEEEEEGCLLAPPTPFPGTCMGTSPSFCCTLVLGASRALTGCCCCLVPRTAARAPPEATIRGAGGAASEAEEVEKEGSADWEEAGNSSEEAPGGGAETTVGWEVWEDTLATLPSSRSIGKASGGNSDGLGARRAGLDSGWPSMAVF